MSGNSGEHRFSAVILAGGRSSRMGQDKALLRHGETSLLDYIQQVLQQAGASEILVARNQPGSGFIQDNFPQQGPLAGIEACLRYCTQETVVVVPVDLPNLTAAGIQQLVNAYFKSGSRPARFEQSELPCVLHNTPLVRAWLREQLSDAQGERSVRQFLCWCDAQHVCCSQASELVNTNTPEQWRQAGFKL